MDEPKNYAIIQNGVVTNIISLLDSNASDFPEAVPCRDAAIGYLYQNGEFINPNPEEI